MRFLAFIVYLTTTSIGSKPSSNPATTTSVSSGANLPRKSKSVERHTRKSRRRRVGTTMTFRHNPGGADRECHYGNNTRVVDGSASRYYQPTGLEGYGYDHGHDHEHWQVQGYGLCSHGYHNEYNTMYGTHDHEHISFAMKTSAPPPLPPTQKWKPKPKQGSTLSGWLTRTFPLHSTINPHSPTPSNQKTQQSHHRYHRHDAWDLNSHAYHQINPPHEPIMSTYPPYNYTPHHQGPTHQRKEKKSPPDKEKGKHGTSGYGRGKRVHFEISPGELAYHSPHRDHSDGVGWGEIAKLGK